MYTTILDTAAIIMSYHLFCTSAMQMRTEVQSNSWQVIPNTVSSKSLNFDLWYLLHIGKAGTPSKTKGKTYTVDAAMLLTRRYKRLAQWHKHSSSVLK